MPFTKRLVIEFADRKNSCVKMVKEKRWKLLNNGTNNECNGIKNKFIQYMNDTNTYHYMPDDTPLHPNISRILSNYVLVFSIS